MPREVLLEMERHGRVMLVRAIDTESLLEVSFQAPVATPHGDIERLALAKIAFRLSKENERNTKAPAKATPTGSSGSNLVQANARRGLVA
jgi:hypothetical protein